MMKTVTATFSPDSQVSAHDDGLVQAIKKASQEAQSSVVRKVSYAISCSSEFRDAVIALADAKKVNVGDIARSAMLTLPAEAIENFPDPGEPDGDDREVVILKSGPSEGKPWRRKPRLQVRMPAGFDVLAIRKALGLALKLDGDELNVALEDAESLNLVDAMAARDEENLRLKSIISALSFDVLPGGVRSRNEALFVLGFPPESKPDLNVLKARFRMLATIHHPDSGVGDHGRMSQLNEAVALLRRLY